MKRDQARQAISEIETALEKCARISAISLPERMEEMRAINNGLLALSKAIRADDESVSQAMDRLVKSEPAFYRSIDNLLRDLPGAE